MTGIFKKSLGFLVPSPKIAASNKKRHCQKTEDHLKDLEIDQ
jgi:hypothetical protein